MRSGRILIAERGEVIVPRARRTTTLLERMRGLLWRPPLERDEGLLISPCGSIHTMGMAYPIDVVFLDRKMWVHKLVPNVAPWRSARCRRAIYTLELPAGSVARLSLEMFQVMEWQDGE